MISKFRLWCLPVMLLTVQACLAEAPSGLVRFTAAELGVPVYDVSGGYLFEQDIIAADDTVLPLQVGLEVYHDAKGKLIGEGNTIVKIGEEYVGASYTVSGRVTRGSGLTKVLMTVRLKGVGFVAGVNTDFSIKLSYKLQINALSLTGTVSGKASFSGLGSGKVTNLDQASLTLPADTTGEWEVRMNVVTLGRISGTGYVYVPAKDRVIPGNVKGSYKASTDLSKVSLKGINEGRGTSLSTRFYTYSDGSHALERIKGTVLGQKVNVQYDFE